MKYFIDQEFIEGFHKPLFGKKRHFIDLISIGIVAEDGRTFYAISKDFDLKAAWNKYDIKGTGKLDLPGINRSTEKVYWLRENVLKHIFEELHQTFKHEPNYKGSVDMAFCFDSLKYLIEEYGKSNKQIATEIMIFIWNDTWSEWMGSSDEFFERGKRFGWNTDTPIEFYGYYADYDWVLFCSLFGRMINLPSGFPMYCRDLKQMLDEKVDKSSFYDYGVPLKGGGANGNLEGKLRLIKERIDYPKQTNEHNALADAKWNFELYKFLQKF